MYEPEYSTLGDGVERKIKHLRTEAGQPPVRVHPGRRLSNKKKKENRRAVVQYARRYGYQRYDSFPAIVRAQAAYWPGAFVNRRRTSRRWGPLAKKRQFRMSKKARRKAERRLMVKKTLKHHGYVKAPVGLSGLGLTELQISGMVTRLRGMRGLAGTLRQKAELLSVSEGARWIADLDIIDEEIRRLEDDIRNSRIDWNEAGVFLNGIQRSLANLQVSIPGVVSPAAQRVVETFEAANFIDMPEDSDWWTWATRQPKAVWWKVKDLARGTTASANLRQQWAWENKLANLAEVVGPNHPEYQEAAIHVKAGRKVIEDMPGFMEFFADVARETAKQVKKGPWNIAWWQWGALAAGAVVAYGAATGAGGELIKRIT